MSTPFDPRKVLKQIDNPLLREFFRRRDELEDVPWDDLTPHRIEPIFDAWQALPDEARNDVHNVMQQVHDLADPRAIQILAEELGYRAGDRLAEFDELRSRQSKAMWAFLHFRPAFKAAGFWSHADALQGGRSWNRRNGLPVGAFEPSDLRIRSLATELTEYYSTKELRGRHCKVEHHQRHDGPHYFFAYLENYPEAVIEFNAENELEPRSARQAFENVFVFDPTDGSMELCAHGGLPVWNDLQVAFCRAMLGIDVEPVPPQRPVFRLDELLSPDFQMPLDPLDGVDEATITMLRLREPGSRVTYDVRLNRHGGPGDLHRELARCTNLIDRRGPGVQVLAAGFRLRLARPAQGGQRTLPIRVTAPNGCDLKTRPDDLRSLGERCLRRWGVLVDAG